jgi:DNA-binding NtrC family response regulator
MTDIVYIDDEPALLRASELVLESCGLSVVTFERPEEAITFIHDHDVGIVCCDFRMPRMTGLEVLRAMKKEIPFFLISGDIQIQEELKNEPGLSGFLAKPLSFFDLAELAKETLGKSHLPLGPETP